MNHQKHSQLVDAKGLNCPLPILKARKAIMSMKKGEILCVISTDKTSTHDFPVFAEQTGNKLIDSYEGNGAYYYYLLIG